MPKSPTAVDIKHFRECRCACCRTWCALVDEPEFIAHFGENAPAAAEAIVRWVNYVAEAKKRLARTLAECAVIDADVVTDLLRKALAVYGGADAP